MTILDRLVAGRLRRLRAMQAAQPLARSRARALEVQVLGGFAAALIRGGQAMPRIIAELKRASPSEGVIRPDLDVSAVAAGLARAGAAALSVLTEPDHFRGEEEDLRRARNGAPMLPLLRKDFLLDPWQVWESRLLGADAVLLIVRLLPGTRLGAMLEEAERADLEALVEVRDEAELACAVAAGARVVGVNARDLSDFSVDLARVTSLAARFPAGVRSVAESGIRGRADLTLLARSGFDAALVGTVLMRAPDPGVELAGWSAGTEGERSAT